MAPSELTGHSGEEGGRGVVTVTQSGQNILREKNYRPFQNPWELPAVKKIMGN